MHIHSSDDADIPLHCSISRNTAGRAGANTMLLRVTEVLCMNLSMERAEGQVLLDYGQGRVFVGMTPVLCTNTEGCLQWMPVGEWPDMTVHRYEDVVADPRLRGIAE